jgi:hypothetical protein
MNGDMFMVGWLIGEPLDVGLRLLDLFIKYQLLLGQLCCVARVCCTKNGGGRGIH